MSPRLAMFLCCAAFATSSLAAGFLDPTFGNNGVAVVPQIGNSSNYGRDGTVDAQGRPIVVGEVYALGSREHATIARLTPQGGLDATFGNAGSMQVPATGTHKYTSFRAVEMAPDGKIVAAGISKKDIDGIQAGRVLVCRFLDNGTRDAGFGIDGCTLVGFKSDSDFDVFLDVAVKPDGRVLVYGTTGGNERRPSLAQLDADGVRDLCYHDITCINGGAYVGVTGQQEAGHMSLDSQGRALTTARRALNMLISRNLPDGRLDVQFGVNGYREVWLGLDDATRATNAIELANGSYVAVGHTNSGTDRLVGIAKLKPDGDQDLFFGGFGINVIHFTDVSFGNQTFDVREQSDGKLLMAGWTQSIANINFEESRDCAVARFTAIGQLDDTFGFGGRNNYDSSSMGASPRFETCSGMSIQGNRIYLFGFVGTFSEARFMVMRLDQDNVFVDQFE